jgi:peptidoglycan/LPS O-acetylase OafA/YrhL
MAGLAVAGGHTKAIYHGFTFLFALAAAVVLLAVLVSDDDPAWLVRLRRPLTSVVSLGLGRVSYALYLWHPTVVSWIDRSHLAARIGTPASRLAAIGLAVACASASYHGVERPFLRRKRKLARVGGSSAEPVPTAARAVLAPAASEA